MKALGRLDDVTLQNAKRRVELLQSNIEREEYDEKKLKQGRGADIHVVKDGDYTSLRRLNLTKLTRTTLEKLFECEIAYLEDQFGTIGKRMWLAVNDWGRRGCAGREADVRSNFRIKNNFRLDGFRFAPVWPEDWMQQCKVAPFIYFIRERRSNNTFIGTCCCLVRWSGGRVACTAATLC